ncbi:MAG: pyrroloquinoline quinone biosynthesis peptide chaperone PqqD [Myxococcales bacterium]|nr:pyrroloquinoline quinone biosynthesis peptide chaperone PqqD [Myxococcales bacterium]
MRYEPLRATHVLLSPEGVTTLSESAAAVCEALAAPRSVDAVVSAVAAAYGVPEEALRDDVVTMLEAFVARGFLREIAPAAEP